MINMHTITIPATKAKTLFGELIEQAKKAPVTVTRNNRPVAVVLSPEQFEKLTKADGKHRFTKAEMFNGATFKSKNVSLSKNVDEIVYG